MHPKLKRAAKFSSWAFAFWFIVFSLITKVGYKKHAPNQPLSWEQWIDQLPIVVAMALISSAVIGLGSLLEKMPLEEEFICPRCGIDQPDRKKDLLSETRTCIACKETSPKSEWKSLAPNPE